MTEQEEAERRRLEERFWARVRKLDETGCWEWTGRRDRNGYGRIDAEAGERWRPRLAHRVAFALLRGALSDDLVLDHACRVRCCVNPDHLEQVTAQENGRRVARAPRTHCRRGHELAGANLLVERSGGRRCLECKRRVAREFAARHRAGIAAREKGSGMCHRGHELSGENVRRLPSVQRVCRTCIRLVRRASPSLPTIGEHGEGIVK